MLAQPRAFQKCIISKSADLWKVESRESWIPCVLWLDRPVHTEHEPSRSRLLWSDALPPIWERTLRSTVLAQQPFPQHRHHKHLSRAVERISFFYPAIHVHEPGAASAPAGAAALTHLGELRSRSRNEVEQRICRWKDVTETSWKWLLSN